MDLATRPHQTVRWFFCLENSDKKTEHASDRLYDPSAFSKLHLVVKAVTRLVIGFGNGYTAVEPNGRANWYTSYIDSVQYI